MIKNAVFIVMFLASVAFGIYFIRKNKKQHEEIEDLGFLILSKLDKMDKKVDTITDLERAEKKDVENIKENVQHFDYEELITKWKTSREALIKEGASPLLLTPDDIRKKLAVLYPLVVNPAGNTSSNNKQSLQIQYTIDNDFSNTADGQPMFKFDEKASQDMLQKMWNEAVAVLLSTQTDVTYESVFDEIGKTQYVERQMKDFIINNNWISVDRTFDIRSKLFPYLAKNNTQEFLEKNKLSEFSDIWKRAKIAVLTENFATIIENSTPERIKTIREEIISYLKTKSQITPEIAALIIKYSVI